MPEVHGAGKGLQTQADAKQGICKAGQQSLSEFCFWFFASRHMLLRLQVKERLKSSKQEKAALRSADAKRGSGKAAKSVPGARAPGAKSGTRR